MKIFINIILFYVCWFSCILGAAKQDYVSGPVVTLCCFFIHLILHRNHWTRELKLGILVMLVGSLFDSLLPRFSLVTFSTPEPTLLPFYPAWMSMLWLGFSSTLTVSLKWLQQKLPIALLFGLLGGPITFIAAEKLGAVHISEVHGYFFALLSIGFVWGLTLPIVVTLSRSQKF
jgi:hypothetical protein